MTSWPHSHNSLSSIPTLGKTKSGSWADSLTCLQAPNFLFFKFLQLNDPKKIAVNLAELHNVPQADERTAVYHLTLRKGQQSAMDAFYDKLKAQQQPVDWVRPKLPEVLRTTQFAEELKWFLSCHHPP